MSDEERDRSSRGAFGPRRWAIVAVLGVVAVSMLLAPGQWLIEESGLRPLVGIALVLAIETAVAIGIATTVLWGSDTTRGTLEEEYRY
ncbi:hypothetical protein BRC86_09440 [Halobacteriales archaeon QS_3_64_16]|nr:MAG: hypothetical protein BRC86_09440 [Halobacteriales archaeon QS_3_64_16]